MIGTIVIDEQVFPIEELHLRKGGVEFILYIPAKTWNAWVGNTLFYAIFGEDGEQLFLGRTMFIDGPVADEACVGYALSVSFIDKISRQAKEVIERGIG